MNKKNIIRKIQVEFCRKCELENGKKDIDICFKCKWHNYFNELYEKFNGEKT